MRVLQLIDTLRAAGAERVAVNYANALVPHIEKSYLCTTRSEGPLADLLDEKVGYLYLQRKKRIDFKAFSRLNEFIQERQIDIIHAHATSYFIGWVIKMRNPGIKLIWHIHHGALEGSKSLKSYVMKICSVSCSSIITVNEPLREWVAQHFYSKHIFHIKNFVIPVENRLTHDAPDLPGTKGKRIVCVANLRPEKNHGLLLDAFKQVLTQEPEATLHLYGMAYEDIYSASIKAIAGEQPQVYYHGLHTSISELLSLFDVGVLSSDSEGLPLVLLEYASAGLAVVITNVGQCAEVIGEYGRVIPPQNREALAESLLFYLKNKSAREKDGLNLKNHIAVNYGIRQIIPQVLQCYEAVV